MKEKTVLYKFLKILYTVIPFALLIIWPGKAVSQYNVSGIVDFSYRNNESKINNNTVLSDSSFVQDYQVAMQGDVWDPRFLKLNAGAGYSVISSKSGQDSSMLMYNLNASFFPGMRVSWDLFGRKSTNTVQSTSSIAGYDVKTTSYGGTLYLRSGGSGGNRNSNNNNNNYNSGFRRSYSQYLPDLVLSRIHTESESPGLSNPIHQTRDDTKAALAFRGKSSYEINLDGGLEQFEDLVNQSSYDVKTAHFSSNFRVMPEADLKLNGNMTDRSTQNMAAFAANEKTTGYGMMLDFHPKGGLRHFYRYDYQTLDNTLVSYDTRVAEAQVNYQIMDNISLRGGVNYSVSNYLRKVSTSTPVEDRSKLENGSLFGGATYAREYAPEFLGPFAFNTSYDFNVGYAKLSDQTAGQEGSGRYYTNNVGLGLNSKGWTKDNIYIGYNFSNKRDQSPLQNDTKMQTFKASVATSRIEKTKITANAGYTSQTTQSSGAGTQFIPQTGINLLAHSFTYDVRAEYAAASFLNFAAGAVRARTTNNTYSLSTLTPQTTTFDDLYYGEANFAYSFGRNMQYRAQLRDEERKSQLTNTQSYLVNMNLDYRIRMIFVNFEYRWKQDNPENNFKMQQQYYFVKLSRPF